MARPANFSLWNNRLLLDALRNITLVRYFACTLHRFANLYGHLLAYGFDVPTALHCLLAFITGEIPYGLCAQHAPFLRSPHRALEWCCPRAEVEWNKRLLVCVWYRRGKVLRNCRWTTFRQLQRGLKCWGCDSVFDPWGGREAGPKHRSGLPLLPRILRHLWGSVGRFCGRFHIVKS